MRSRKLRFAGVLLGGLGLGGWTRAASYPETILADEPVAYWRFEEDAGAAVLEDESGNGHESVAINNAVTGQEGAIGKAIEFNGVDATVELNFQFNPADPEGDGVGVGPGDFSIELFIKPTEVANAPRVILAQQNGRGLGRSNFLLTVLDLRIGSFMGGATTASAVRPEPNTWYHVIMTYDGTPGQETIRFYINGEFAGASDPGSRVAESADGNWIIGSHKSQANSFYAGLVDELSFYDYRLDDPDGDGDTSDSKVQSHYEAAMGELVPCTGMTVSCGVDIDSGSVQIQVSTEPEGCSCTVANVYIDDIPAGMVGIGPSGSASVPLPEFCEPLSEHELKLECLLNGVSATCVFTCPCEQGSLSCSVSEEGTLLLSFTQAPDPCFCTSAEISIDGTPAGTVEISAEGQAELDLPQQCEAGTIHTLTASCDVWPQPLSCTFRCPGGEEAYAQVVLADKPVAYYRFEEVEGDTVVEDETGNGHDSISITNAYLGAGGFLGRAVEFRGDGSILLDLQLNPADPEGDGQGVGLGDFSIELFVNPAAPGPDQVILSQQNGTGMGRSNFLLTNVGPFGTFMGGFTTASTVTPEANTWYHVVMTYDGGQGSETVRFYVNGEFAGSGGPIAEPADGNWVIGSHKSQSRQFYTGLVDELAFYDYRLDDPNGDDDTADSRVRAHYEASVVPPPECTEIGVSCTAGQDGITVQVSLTPAGCNCTSVDLFIDDTPVGSQVLGPDGALSVALPAQCAAGSEHTLRVVCTTSGLSGECTFTCPGGAGTLFKRGDSNADGSLNIADAISTLGFLFGGEAEPPCMSAADANDDGNVNIADAIRTLGYLFSGVGDLPAPFADCGTDPTPDELDCKSFDPCR